MKKILKFLVFPAALIAAVVLIKKHCSNGECDQDRNIRRKIGDFIFNKIAKKLDINDEQRDKIRKIFTEIKEKIKEHNGFCFGIKDLIVTQLRSDEVNREEIEKTMDEKKKSCEEIRPFIIDKFTEFHNILSSWQRFKLSEKIEKIYNKIKCC